MASASNHTSGLGVVAASAAHPESGEATGRADVAEQSLPRHVPIVLYVDASWEVGGLVGYAVGLAGGFVRRGHRVAAICNRSETVAPMREMLRQIGVDVRTVEDDDNSFTGRLRRVRAFGSLMREYNGCVLALLMGYFTSGGVITLAGALAGAGAIVRADLTGPVPPISWRQKLGVRLKDSVTQRIVVGAGENREAFVQQAARADHKFRVVHTGIGLEKYQAGGDAGPVREAFGYRPDTLVVGTISRLSEERKGLSYFLEMASVVAPVFPRAEFLIVGDGLLRSRLEQQAAELGIADRVTFAGWRSDIPELLKAMDIFVMPSLFEGGPTTVLEAMAMGRPVVATSVGMVPEVVVHERSGLVVPPGDAAALADAVTALLGSDELRTRLGTRALEEAQKSFSIDRMVERYLAVFAEARGRNRDSRLRSFTRRSVGVQDTSLTLT